MNFSFAARTVTLCALLWIINLESSAAADDTSMPYVVELQSLRKVGVPALISPGERTYYILEKLGASPLNKEAIATELINWVFVIEPRPKTFEKIGLLRIHPAARALIKLGEVSKPLFIAKLRASTSDAQAELLVRCVSLVAKEQTENELRSVLAGTHSGYAESAISLFLNRERNGG